MNTIKVPFEHKMFQKEFSGELLDFIFDEFIIAFTLKNEICMAIAVCFNKDISGTQLQLIAHGKEMLNEEVWYEIHLKENSVDGMSVTCNTSDERYTNIGHCLAQYVLRVMLYIMIAKREKSARPKETPRGQKESAKESNKHYDKEVFLLDEIIEYVNENGMSQGSHTGNPKNCPCWSVRGHYRHYKSGKVIFVKEYEKGKQRGKEKPRGRTYAV